MALVLTAGQWLYIVCVGLVLLFSVVGNFLVIYCMNRLKTLRTVTNVLISNLAVSDILLAGFVMPMRVHDISHTNEFHEGVFACKFINFFPIFVITSSAYTLVCVSVERRRAIKDTHKQKMSISTLKRVIPAMWLFSFLVSAPSIVEYDVNEISVHTPEANESTILVTCSSHHMPSIYSNVNAVFVVLVSYVFPVLVMMVNYLQLAHFVWRKGRQIHAATTNARAKENAQRFQRRITIVKMLVAVAVIFAVSWLPFYVTFLYAKVTNNDASDDASSALSLFLNGFATFSTAYNVVLYVIFNPGFNKAIKTVLRCQSLDSMDKPPPIVAYNEHNNGELQPKGGGLNGTSGMSQNNSETQLTQQTQANEESVGGMKRQDST